MINKNIHVLQISLSRNGFFPNNELPVLLYKNVFNLNEDKTGLAEFIIEVFTHNNWLNAWKNGIYDYHHYHSTTHECLAIAAGTASVVLGGPGGRKIELVTGDVLILPAGTGHMCTTASADFVCVGAYPEGKEYDMKYGKEEEFSEAVTNIEQLRIPAFDPVYGQHARLHTYWREKGYAR